MHQVLPPYLVAGETVETYQACELMCAAQPKCRYGSMLFNDDGTGACYLAERGLAHQQPCVTRCHSFRKIALAKGQGFDAQHAARQGA